MTRKRSLDVARRRRPKASQEATFYIQPVGAERAEGGLDVPDLLHASARPWGDLSGSVELVRFGFEGGDCAGVFDMVIAALPLSPTNLKPESFASQIYIDDLIESCLHVSVGGVRRKSDKGLLKRIVECPPSANEDLRTRQAVLRELVEKPTLRAELETLYLALLRLRDALEASASTEPNVVRRKILVLVALQETVNAMADGFDSSSVLSRLRDKGVEIREHPGWKPLTDLVDLEGNVATVDVRLRLGSDGTVRGFGVLAIRERSLNDMLPGPFGRLMQQLASFFRGYRYGENEVVVRLLEDVFQPFVEDVVSILAMTGAIELYLSAMHFRDAAAGRGLEVCLPEVADVPPLSEERSEERYLEGLFNPLLFLQGVTPVPCSIPPLPHDALVVITGPNSGGKTRLLQSLALSQLLGEAGLFVPAKKARLVRAPKLFLSLVADGDAGQIEGRLGTELLRIRALFEQLEPGALAMLDELCSGTNPNEGEAIFEWVVSLLPRLRPQVVVSTHFLGLAARLKEANDPRLTFLQVELDADEKPTYQFVPGVATTSLAHRVAERLGVTKEALLALVEAKLPAKEEAPLS